MTPPTRPAAPTPPTAQSASTSPPNHLPERVRLLAAITQNLWWSWQLDARELFHRIDHRLWEDTRHNAVQFLRQVTPDRLEHRAKDPAFLERYDQVVRRFGMLAETNDTWFATRYPQLVSKPIAYFSAEFALHRSLPIYSGGLGVLAGDHCKEASDLGVPLVGVGLYYHGGYFDQRIGMDGWQGDSDDPIDPAMNPVVQVNGPDGDPCRVPLTISGREVQVGAWRVMVGRVPVYLLDTDLDCNDPADRKLTARLYTSAAEWRLRQEWVLGVGGVRVLRALGINPEIWHANEGHAGFMYLERMRELVAGGLTAKAAQEQIRATSVFTTHTPVPAGHDVFSFTEIEQVTGPFWNTMGMTRDQFLAFGQPGTKDQHFEMTVLSLRLAGRVNGVSARHREESRRIWRWVWGKPAAEIPIGYVTNGVHLGTWMARPIRDLLAESLGPDWESRTESETVAAAVRSLDDARLWAVHEGLRHLLFHYVREEARHRWRAYWKDPAKLAGAGALLSPNVLTLGFARRFATYKRADLLFRDPERLKRLLTDPRRPVQIIFSGKAHPADDPGKRVLQRIFQAAQDPSFEGRIAFLEDYELHLAQRMVAGVDVWINLPRVPLEACGTSGMKAALNGVPQLGTLDGWWAEGYTKGENGWAIPLPAADAEADQSDMEHLFGILEHDIVPCYYDRVPGQHSAEWVHMMKGALAVAVERFTTRQMLQTYVTQYYVPAAAGEAISGDPPP